MVFVTNSDGSQKIDAVSYSELKEDARKEARETKKALTEITVVPEDTPSEANTTSTQELSEWTNSEGKTIKARINAKEETRVQFEMQNGKLVWYPIEKLSAESQEILARN